MKVARTLVRCRRCGHRKIEHHGHHYDGGRCSYNHPTTTPRCPCPKFSTKPLTEAASCECGYPEAWHVGADHPYREAT